MLIVNITNRERIFVPLNPNRAEDPKHSGFLKVSQKDREPFELPRIKTYAQQMAAVYALFGAESPITTELVDELTAEIDSIFEKLIALAEEDIAIQHRQNPEAPANTFALDRLLYMRNRLVIGNMPANAGGFYDFQKVAGSNMPDILAGEDYIALSPMCFFWSKDMLARVLVHELIHAGGHPYARSPVTEESITDSQAGFLCKDLGYQNVRTGYQHLIEGIQQYLYGIPAIDVMRCIVCKNGIIDSEMSLRNLIKLIFLKQNVADLNLNALADSALFRRIQKGIDGLKAYLPRMFNDIYDPNAGIHAETTQNVSSEQVVNDVNVSELLLEELVAQGNWHDFACKFIDYEQVGKENIRSADAFFVMFINNLERQGYPLLAKYILKACQDIKSPVREMVAEWLNNQEKLLIDQYAVMENFRNTAGHTKHLF